MNNIVSLLSLNAEAFCFPLGTQTYLPKEINDRNVLGVSLFIAAVKSVLHKITAG